MTAGERGERRIVAVHDLQHALERRRHALPSFRERRLLHLHPHGGLDGAEERLELDQALGLTFWWDRHRLGGGEDIGTELDELAACPGQVRDQAGGGGRARLLESPGSIAQLGTEIHEALGQRGQLSGQRVQVSVHPRSKMGRSGF